MFAFLYLYADIHSVTLSRWIGARAKYTFFFAILFIPHVVTTHLTSSNVVCLFPPPHHYACAFTASIWMSLIYIHMRTNRKKKKHETKSSGVWQVFDVAVSITKQATEYFCTHRISALYYVYHCANALCVLWLCALSIVFYMDYCSCVEVAACLGVPRLGWLWVRAEMAYRHRHARNYRNNKYNVNGRAQQCAKDGQQ